MISGLIVLASLRESSMADSHNKDMYNVCEFHTRRH